MQNIIETLEAEHIEVLRSLKRKPAVFADKETCSSGKNETEAYQDGITGDLLNDLNETGNAKCAVLIGSVKGLMRQVRRYRKLGYTDSNIVIFEWAVPTAYALKQAVKRRGLKVTVICCDLIKGVDVLAANGVKFNYIEFDSVEQFGTREPLLYKLVKKWNIPVLITQGSGRGQHEWFKTQAKKLGAKTYLNHGYECYKLEDSANKIISKNLRGYKSHLITYGGRETINKVTGQNQAAPMYMAISIQK